MLYNFDIVCMFYNFGQFLPARPAQAVRQVRHLPDHFSGQTPEKNYNISFHQM